MIDIVEIKKAVKDGVLEFYTNDKGTIFCRDIENRECVAVGYESVLMQLMSEMLDESNKKLGIK